MLNPQNDDTTLKLTEGKTQEQNMRRSKRYKVTYNTLCIF